MTSPASNTVSGVGFMVEVPLRSMPITKQRFIADAGFPDGVPHERCALFNDELFEADLGRTLLFQFLFPSFYPVFHEFTEYFNLFVRCRHDDVVERVQAFLSAGDVDTFFSAGNGNNTYPASLAEVQFFQRFSDTGGGLRYLEISQVEIPVEQVFHETLFDGGFAFLLLLACREVTQETPFQLYRVFFQPFGIDEEQNNGTRDHQQ